MRAVGVGTHFCARDVVLRNGLSGLGLRRARCRKLIKNPVQTTSILGPGWVPIGPRQA